MRESLTHPNTKRFQVALSFAGEHRTFVEGVAEHLSRSLGQHRVFYDRYYEAELARPNLDTYLINIYQAEAELIAIFLCANYTQKDWCHLEWRVVRDILKRRQDSDIMLFRFDNVMIEGLLSIELSIDGYREIGQRTPEEVAGLILQRMAGNNPVSRSTDLTPPSVSTATATPAPSAAAATGRGGATAPPRYTGAIKLNVCHRLVSDWQNLADYLDIPPSDRAGFDRGREPQGVWEWLEARGRLPELANALVAIGRADLVEVLQHHPR